MLYENGASVFDAAGFNKLAAQIEAAGCTSAANPLECYRATVQAGKIAASTDVSGAAANIVQACKNGGVASCTEVLRQNEALGVGCLSDLISSWHPNIICDCATMKCAEIEALTAKQRDQQQGASGIPSWLYVAGIGGALGAAYLMMRK